MNGQRHRAIIVGAGRIGTGFDWPETPYIYTHADAYLALKKRVELVGIVDPDKERREYAYAKYHVPVYDRIGTAIEKGRPDIASICTPPSEREDVFERKNSIEQCSDVRGIWCEKPLSFLHRAHIPFVQVNYIRRFDPLHRWFLGSDGLRDSTLTVWAKMDVHTVCHFTDLARFWGVKALVYHKHDGPCSYQLSILEGHHFAFPDGGVVGGFMEAALSNLLDALEGTGKLISPASSAIESEKWADEILKERGHDNMAK